MKTIIYEIVVTCATEFQEKVLSNLMVCAVKEGNILIQKSHKKNKIHINKINNESIIE